MLLAHRSLFANIQWPRPDGIALTNDPSEQIATALNAISPSHRLDGIESGSIEGTRYLAAYTNSLH